MDLRTRLQTHMDSEMRRIPFTDLGDVMERGEVIRSRRRLVSVAVPAAAVLLVVAGLALSRQLPGTDESVDDVAAANARLTEGTLDWNVSPATLGMLQFQQVTAEGIMYVLSTAPGARWEDFPNGDIPEAIYTSTDGTTWDSIPLGGSWVSAISASQGLLYAVGTAPGADADSLSLQVGIFAGEGDGPRTVNLPLGPAASGSHSTQIMATEGGVLATGSIRVFTDPWTLLPPEVLSGEVEPVTTDAGVAVFPVSQAPVAYEVCGGSDPEACQALVESEATYFASWEELGFDAAEISFGEAVTNVSYWSPDGTEFTEIEYPFPNGWFDRAFNVDGNSVVSIGGAAQARLFASADARTWREVAADTQIGAVLALGEVGDEVVMVGHSADFRTIAVYRAPGLDGPWQPLPLDDVVPQGGDAEVWINTAAVGEGGVAVSFTAATEQSVSNPIADFFNRLGNRAERQVLDEGALDIVEAMLVSPDLEQWTLVPGPSRSGMVDSLMFTPDGALVAHSSESSNGRPTRIQATATP